MHQNGQRENFSTGWKRRASSLIWGLRQTVKNLKLLTITFLFLLHASISEIEQCVWFIEALVERGKAFVNEAERVSQLFNGTFLFIYRRRLLRTLWRSTWGTLVSTR